MALSNTSTLNRASAYLTDSWQGACDRWNMVPVSLRDGFVLWLGWTGLTWTAFALSLTFIEIGERGDLSLLDSLMGGGLVGFAQWLMIRPHLKRAYGWIGLSVLCWGALTLLSNGLTGGAVGWIAPTTLNLFVRVLLGLLNGFCVGLVLGAGQWWMLRQRVEKAWRWIWLSAGIWSVAIAFGWLLGGVLRLVSNLFVAEVIGLGVAWAIVAALSGMAVVGMVYQKRD